MRVARELELARLLHPAPCPDGPPCGGQWIKCRSAWSTPSRLRLRSAVSTGSLRRTGRTRVPRLTDVTVVADTGHVLLRDRPRAFTVSFRYVERSHVWILRTSAAVDGNARLIPVKVTVTDPEHDGAMQAAPTGPLQES